MMARKCKWLFAWRENGRVRLQIAANLSAARELEDALTKRGVLPQISRIKLGN